MLTKTLSGLNEIASGEATENSYVSSLKNILGPHFTEFPQGTEYRFYQERNQIAVPVARVPKSDGGEIFLAFDMPVPREVSSDYFEKSDIIEARSDVHKRERFKSMYDLWTW